MSGSKSSNPDAAVAKIATHDEPLTMTVYSLPNPEGEASYNAAQTRSGRLKLLLLFAICAAPVIASYFTYYVIRPQARSSYGQLIDPQRPLPEWSGRDLAGQPVALSSLKDQWLLISVADSQCDKRCESHLYMQRQIREALGKDKERLEWIWLRTGDTAVRDEIKPALQAATVLAVDGQSLGQWLEPEAGHALADHLYVVDPLGNWMMRFPADADPYKVRKDLERLLRASSFWDKAGRGDASKD